MAALSCSCWRMKRTETRAKSRTSWVMLKTSRGFVLGFGVADVDEDEEVGDEVGVEVLVFVGGEEDS